MRTKKQVLQHLRKVTRKMSNKDLLWAVNKTGGELLTISKIELAKRKAAGTVRSDAGKKKKRSQGLFDYDPFSRY